MDLSKALRFQAWQLESGELVLILVQDKYKRQLKILF